MMNTIGTTITTDFGYRRLTPEITIATFLAWEALPGLTHFVTLRGEVVPDNPFSTFNLGRHSGEDLSQVLPRREALCRALSIPARALVQPRQVHGTEVVALPLDFPAWDENRQSELLAHADGVVTDLAQVCVAVSTADCAPLLFYDPRRRVVGASHAGWRGTVGHIAARTVAVMQKHYGCLPQDILTAIGPSIGVSAFEVGDEVAEAFEVAYPSGIISCEAENHGLSTDESDSMAHYNRFAPKIVTPRRADSSRHHIDLWAANIADLCRAGIAPRNITLAGLCTYTRNDLFFSSRRALHSAEAGRPFGRFLTGVMLQAGE